MKHQGTYHTAAFVYDDLLSGRLLAFPAQFVGIRASCVHVVYEQPSVRAGSEKTERMMGSFFVAIIPFGQHIALLALQTNNRIHVLELA